MYLIVCGKGPEQLQNAMNSARENLGATVAGTIGTGHCDILGAVWHVLMEAPDEKSRS